MQAQLDLQNIANRKFIYNFGNPFSRTHFGHPRPWADGLNSSSVGSGFPQNYRVAELRILLPTQDTVAVVLPTLQLDWLSQ